MKAFIKIFRFFPPETAHHLALLSLKILNKVRILKLFFPDNKDFDNPKEYFNLKFRNTLGVAAGLDKNGDYVDELETRSWHESYRFNARFLKLETGPILSFKDFKKQRPGL